MSHLSSSKGLIALLAEPDDTILEYAVTRLLSIVDEFWFEMSNTSDLSLFEEIQESASFTKSAREKYALLLARIYFHMSVFDDSVRFALAAGTHFNGNDRSLFTQTILGRCIDAYVENREAHYAVEALRAENPDDAANIPDAPEVDPRLEELFISLAELWQADSVFAVSVRELVGFFLRARRLDLLEKVLTKHVQATNNSDVLNHTLTMAQTHVTDIGFRREVLQVLVKMYSIGLNSVDYSSLSQCLMFLGDYTRMAEILKSLLTGPNKDTLRAYQIAFDVFDHSNLEFVQKVSDLLMVDPSEAMDCNEEDGNTNNTTTVTEVPTTVTGAAASDAPTQVPLNRNLSSIMSGELTTTLHTKFLYARCNADIHIMNHMKKVGTFQSIGNTAVVLANAIMYSGTTIDGFLRDNLDWLGKITHWGAFTATASIGSIHRGHYKEAMNVLRPYLPQQNNVGPSPYDKSGSLYAMGLIYCSAPVSARRQAITYLQQALTDYGANHIMVHGASIGLGFAAMGTHDEAVRDALLVAATGVDAVACEGAALGVGLTMVGSGDEGLANQLLQLAMSDQKEKTIRGLVMSIALIMLGREKDADPIISKMQAAQDHWIRLGACFTIGLAYAGTSNTKAIEKLLQVCVSDLSDEVRRNSMMMIGFVTFKNLRLCLEMTNSQRSSYNPHIRYGVTMALAIAGCGSANTTAVEVLWEMKDDAVSLVRQGALIALSMVLMQSTSQDVPKVAELRETLQEKSRTGNSVLDDHSVPFGAMIASGLLDAGGRNCIITLHKDGHALSKAVVGLFIFSQYWYWFPYTLAVGMALQPTCVIGLNEKLAMPRFSIISAAPPSRFALPKSVLTEKKEAKAKGTVKAVLSTTAKEQKRKAGAVSGRLSAETPLTAGPGGFPPSDGSADAKKDGDGEDKDKDKKTEEPQTEVLENPARVTMRQRAVIQLDPQSRYIPLKEKPFGIVMLQDTTPEASENLLPEINPLDQVEPPESFMWE